MMPEEAEDWARTALVEIAERLGMDGVVMAINKTPPKAISDEIYKHVLWLEGRARQGGLRKFRERLNMMRMGRMHIQWRDGLGLGDPGVAAFQEAMTAIDQEIKKLEEEEKQHA